MIWGEAWPRHVVDAGAPSLLGFPGQEPETETARPQVVGTGRELTGCVGSCWAKRVERLVAQSTCGLRLSQRIAYDYAWLSKITKWVRAACLKLYFLSSLS